MKPPTTFSGTGWVLAAGFALVAIGLARGAQEEQVTTVAAPMVANADSNNRMIAVTGVDITGASVLYLVDTVNYQMAVYQANGGTQGTQGIKLVGARRIDLDLQLHGFNDKSKFSYDDLRDQFRENGLLIEADTPSDQ